MGLGPLQLSIVGALLRPGMRILTIGRLRCRDEFGHKSWFDEWAPVRCDATIFSLDVSSRDSPDIIVDLNVEGSIDPSLQNSFDFLIDGGSLEHVANTQSALRNYHSLLKVGGKIFLCNPSNGYAGHGLYQFSPEFYYRALSRGNGFESVLALLESRTASPFRPLGYKSRVFLSPDPAQYGRRLGFRGSQETQMLFLAEKNELGPPAFTFVQSDYQDLLDDPQLSDSTKVGHVAWRFLSARLRILRKRLGRTLYLRVKKFVRSLVISRLGAYPLERVSRKELERILGVLGDC